MTVSFLSSSKATNTGYDGIAVREISTAFVCRYRLAHS